MPKQLKKQKKKTNVESGAIQVQRMGMVEETRARRHAWS